MKKRKHLVTLETNHLTVYPNLSLSTNVNNFNRQSNFNRTNFNETNFNGNEIINEIQLSNKDIWRKDEVIEIVNLLIRKLQHEYDYKFTNELTNKINDYIRSMTSSREHNECSYIS